MSLYISIVYKKASCICAVLSKVFSEQMMRIKGTTSKRNILHSYFFFLFLSYFRRITHLGRINLHFSNTRFFLWKFLVCECILVFLIMPNRRINKYIGSSFKHFYYFLFTKFSFVLFFIQKFLKAPIVACMDSAKVLQTEEGAKRVNRFRLQVNDIIYYINRTGLETKKHKKKSKPL